MPIIIDYNTTKPPHSLCDLVRAPSGSIYFGSNNNIYRLAPDDLYVEGVVDLAEVFEDWSGSYWERTSSYERCSLALDNQGYLYISSQVLVLRAKVE